MLLGAEVGKKHKKGKNNKKSPDSSSLGSNRSLNTITTPADIQQPYRLLQRQVESCQQDLTNRYGTDQEASLELKTIIGGVDTLRLDIEDYIRQNKTIKEIKILEGRFQEYRRRLKPLIAKEENRKAENNNSRSPLVNH